MASNTDHEIQILVLMLVSIESILLMTCGLRKAR